MTSEDRGAIGFMAGGIGWLIAVIVGVICLGMWGCPQYTVWQQGKAGEAKLKEAESSRQIAVQEAKAKQESAEMLAEAEVRRALGVAKANEIIGDSLKNHPEYLTYLWIMQVNADGNSVIYVPTEAGLPVLEAGRFASIGAKAAAEKAEKEKAEKEKKK